ncbi:MAG: EamA family transporter [Chloroflexia bacterium]|nr:EamA family transporter [Chloroflexia bacterium]
MWTQRPGRERRGGGTVATTARAAAGLAPPAAYVVAAMVSAQLGASVAKFLFAALGPLATVSLRTAFAALVLLAVWRPHLRGRPRADLLAALALGVTLAGLSLSFYAALERIPLGVAMTLEFAGPLGIALVGSRRRLDLLWGVLAAAGILVLSPLGGTVDPLGAALALLAGAFWAASILLSARIGQAIPGGGGLALAMTVAAVVTLPFGLAAGGQVAADPRVLLTALGVGLLSSVVPFSLELEALRRIPVHVFGLLMSLEPAIAALVGLVVLGEMLGMREIGSIGLVVTASVGATKTAERGEGGAA